MTVPAPGAARSQELLTSQEQLPATRECRKKQVPRGKHSEDAQEKSSRVDAKSILQVLQGSGAVAFEELAVCHLPPVRTEWEGTTVQRSEVIAQLAGVFLDARPALLEKTPLRESKGSCDRNALSDFRKGAGLSAVTDGEWSPTMALLWLGLLARTHGEVAEGH